MPKKIPTNPEKPKARMIEKGKIMVGHPARMDNTLEPAIPIIIPVMPPIKDRVSASMIN